MSDPPPGWAVVRLGEVADTALGKMLDRGNPRGHPPAPYLRNVNVQWGAIHASAVYTMEVAPQDRERFGLQAGDLLVCEGGEIGRCAIWNGPSRYMAYQKALHRVRPGDRLEAAYLRYLLEYYSASGTLGAFATGSTIQHLPQQQLRRVPVPLPSPDEQRRIVAILEDHLSRLDAAQAGLATTRTRLRTLEAAVRSGARKGRSVALGEVAEIQGGIQKQPRRRPRDNAYPFLRVANVTSTGLDLRDIHQVELFDGELDRLRLKRGDLLVVEGNGSPAQIGRAVVWDGSIPDAVHQNHLIRVRPKPDLHPEYLEVVWNSPESRRQLTQISSSSSGLHTLSASKLKSFLLPVPSVAQQAESVAEAAASQVQGWRLNAALNTGAARASHLRRALLAAAFSGRLTGDTIPQSDEGDPCCST